MKKKIFTLTVIAASMLLFSCATRVSNPGYESALQVKLEPKEYEILGDVVKVGTTKNVLGLFTWDGAKYFDLFELAKKKYQADDVINISVDYEKNAYWIFYSSKTYIMRGIAIKYKD